MDKKNKLSKEKLIQGIKDMCENGKTSKLQSVKWVKDHSDLDLRNAKELVDDHFYYKSLDE